MTDFPELPRVKCLFFINPHNPLGVVFDQDYINAIAEIASRHELTIGLTQ
jgi:bifunctional pyridoxal-dependent enzyme with beta-cystathionase and maltose regulon repressor activities